MTFAGAHEEIVVLRRRDGAIENIATPGTWLGARKDVGRFFVDSQLVLDDGDVVVLYTDGITEARGGGGRQFGLEGLTAAVDAVRTKPCVLIRDNVLQAVRRFTARQEDDMTLLVLRYRSR